MDSFYGGLQGISWSIKWRFDSYEDMVAAFKRGAEYEDVRYGEYCIIDTPNKNHKDNGKIYQRGMNYSASNGGAIYIGQIVGPSSGTPYFQLNTIKEVTDRSKDVMGEYDYKRYPTGYKTDTEGHVIGYEVSDGSDSKPIATFPFSKAHDTSLVPGKTDEGSFNDEIKWTWVNIRKDNADADSWFYVGFEIPYLVNEYATHMVSPYDSQGNIVDNATTVNRVDDKEHPFYAKWDLGIPKGIKGDALRNLRIITPTSGDKTKIYSPANITVDNKTGKVTLGEPGYTGIDDDITNSRKILVYDFYYYDSKLNPQPVMVYLGDSNQVDNITLSDDGTLTIDYSHNDNTVFSRKIKWITETTLMPDTGVFTVKYNNGDAAFTTTLDWIKEIRLDEDGTIHYIHTKNNRDESYNHVIKWVTDVELNPTTGLFTMNFNYGDALVRQLDWVDNIYIDEETGEIIVHHVDSTKGSNGNVTLPAKLKLITKASASNDGIITFYTNTNEQFNIKDSSGNQDFHIKMIDDVILNTRLADDKRIFIKYNTENEATPIGAPINYVHDMVVRDSDFHLLVLFNDPTHRATASDLDDNGKDKNGHTWVTNVVGSDGKPVGNGIYWRDYGTIKDQAGILIGLNLLDEQINQDDPSSVTTKDVLDYLNRVYPNGLTQGATKQKIVTFGHTEDDAKDFFAFDYNSYKWFYLGSISDSGMRDAKLLRQEDVNSNNLESVSVNGLVFKILTANGLKTSPIPDFWSTSYTSWE